MERSRAYNAATGDVVLSTPPDHVEAKALRNKVLFHQMELVNIEGKLGQRPSKI